LRDDTGEHDGVTHDGIETHDGMTQASMVDYERSVGFDHGKGGIHKAVGF
jgi:hypothetical protein